MSTSIIQPWTVEHAQQVADRRIFSVHLVRARSRMRPERVGEFVVLDVPDWVNIIALTEDRQVVLVEQYRHGSGSITLELPGGMVDAGEDMVEAGTRELLEETGYASGKVELIGVVEPNPAFQNNRCGTVLVTAACRVAEQALDPNEEIRVRLAPLHQIPELIRSGAITHSLVVAAFYHLSLHPLPLHDRPGTEPLTAQKR